MKTLITTLFTLLILSVAAQAERPTIDRDKLVKQGNNLGAAKILDNFTIDNRSKEEAMKLYNLIEDKVVPKANEYAESITFDNETGVMKFDRVAEKDKSKKNISSSQYFNDKERLYIFISSSIPKPVLQRYADEVDRLGIGRNAIFVIRGCIDTGKGVGGCGDLKPTLEFIKSFAYKKKDVIQSVQLWIDSLLFKKYQISSVPAFVYVDSVELKYGIGSEGKDEMVSTSSYVKSIGDWSLQYHIDKLLAERESQSLKNISKRYADEKAIQ